MRDADPVAGHCRCPAAGPRRCRRTRRTVSASPGPSASACPPRPRLGAGSEGAGARVDAGLAGDLARGLRDAVEHEDAAPRSTIADEQHQEDDDREREFDQRLPVGTSDGARITWVTVTVRVRVSLPTGVRHDEGDRVRALGLVLVDRVLQGRRRRRTGAVTEVPRPGERAQRRRRRQVRELEVGLLLLAGRRREGEVGGRREAERVSAYGVGEGVGVGVGLADGSGVGVGVGEGVGVGVGVGLGGAEPRRWRDDGLHRDLGRGGRARDRWSAHRRTCRGTV